MRTLLAVTLALLGASLPSASRAQTPQGGDPPELVELLVGESKPIGGFRPLCDDPAVAWFAADGSGRLEGLKPGETICSVSRISMVGPRQVYRVVVRVPPPPAPKGSGASQKR